MRRSTRVFVGVLLALFLAIGAGNPFAGAGMSDPAAIALAIMLFSATLWITELIPLFVTSFAILVMNLVWLKPVLESAGVSVAGEAFTSPFFSDTIMLFLGGFVLSAALHKYQLDEDLARWILARSGTSVPGVMAGVMLITAFLSMWISNTAATAMMLGLCLPMVQSLGATSRARHGIILAVPFAANVGGLGTPIGTPPNAIAMEYMRDMGHAPSFASWMLAGIPAVVIMLGLIWLLLLMVFRGTGETVSVPLHARRKRYGPRRRIAIAVALVTATGWVTGALHGYSAGTVSLIPVIVFFGLRLLRVVDLQSISWDVLFVMGGGLCLARTLEVSGLADWLISSLPTEAVTPYVLVVVFGLVACVMSSVMSNTATANLLMPVIAGLALSPISPLFMSAAFACSMAMTLPISTPPNAMAFSTGEVEVRDMIGSGSVITLVGAALTITVFYWWWDLIGMF